jgi:hypothetical protein
MMICGLAMNALVTDANAGTMPVIGMPPTLRPVSPMWHAATAHTRFSILADRASLGLFSLGDVVLLFGGAIVIAICIRRTLRRRSRLSRPVTAPSLQFVASDRAA